MSESKIPKSSAFDVRDIYTIAGAKIAAIYEQNKMAVHFQGMSKTMQFPQTVALQGAPTCSVGISPYGLYNRLNDAGRLIMLNQKAVQFASAPFVRIGDKFTMLTQRQPQVSETPDDVPALLNYYPPSIDEKNISLTIATPSMEMAFKIGKVRIIRRLISPLLSGNEQTLMPIGVEQYEVQNASNEPQTITLVVPRPSLVNLQEKELKPTDQDSVYICSAPVQGHAHEAFESTGVRGVVMGSIQSPNRMVLAAAESPGVSIDTQPYFCLNRLKADLLLNDDGSFHENGRPSSAAIMDQPSASPSPSSPKQPGRLPWRWCWTSPSRSTLTGRNSNASTSRTSRMPDRGRWIWPSSPWTAIRCGGTGP